MTAGLLKEYIANVYSLEMSLYHQRALFKRLLEESTRVGATKAQAITPQMSTKFAFNIKEMLGYAFGGACIGTLVGGFTSVPFFVGIGGGTILALLLWAGLECFDTVNAKRHNKDVNAANQQIIGGNLQKQAYVKRQLAILHQEMDVIKPSFEKTKAVLEKYYSKNIIFPKYRNFLAISSIHEYLSAGRCSTLEGHEGAYNLFEGELRQNMIIGKLEDVINRLDDIERNQHMLYAAVKQSNAGVQRLTQMMDRMADSMDRIENSAEITAYNSAMANKTLKALTWLEVARL